MLDTRIQREKVMHFDILLWRILCYINNVNFNHYETTGHMFFLTYIIYLKNNSQCWILYSLWYISNPLMVVLYKNNLLFVVLNFYRLSNGTSYSTFTFWLKCTTFCSRVHRFGSCKWAGDLRSSLSVRFILLWIIHALLSPLVP